MEEFGRLPPDQSLLTRVLTFKDDGLLERALDELLELDGRGKVRSSPDLVRTIKGIRSKNSGVRELADLLLEKLGAS